MKEAFARWLGGESKTFSMLCGERFTHGEVIAMHALLLLGFIGVGVAGAIG